MSMMAGSQQNASSARRTPRPYRSRRNKPCDACRARKVSCRMENDTCCVSCRKAGRQCTFSESSRQVQQILNSSNVSTNDASNSNGPASLQLSTPHAPRVFGGDVTGDSNMWNSDDAVFDDDVGAGANRAPSPIGIWPLPTMCDGSDLNGMFWDNPIVPETPSIRIGQQSDLYNDPYQNQWLEDTNGTTRTIERQPIESNLTDGELQDCTLTQRETNLSQSNHSAPVNPLMAQENLLLPASDNNSLPSIDQRPGYHVQYFGLSGESDPYLLRQYYYDDTGEFRFHKVNYRDVTAGTRDASIDQGLRHSPDIPHSATALNDDPSIIVQPSSIPVQFLLTADELGEEAKKITDHASESAKITSLLLESFVNQEDGDRLISLFFKYVFPALPVISRSDFQRLLQSEREKIPVYLLAAIYASSVPFCPYDDRLCISKLYKKPPANDLWKIVYSGIQSEMHSPRLAVISAALIYLNKARTGVQEVSADTPFVWSFMASTVALATSLGLHLDCGTWSIPPWEKRLRRRLWWVTYSEEKWRGLLLGRPSLISKDNWNVSELTNLDFKIDKTSKEDITSSHRFSFATNSPDDGTFFQHVLQLAQIVEDVYASLYTIHATQTLANDLNRSVEIAKPLRERLKFWYSTLPQPLLLRNKPENEKFATQQIESNACLHFAYLILEILVYRALLRPLGNDRTTENGFVASERNELIPTDLTSIELSSHPAIPQNKDDHSQSFFREQSEAIFNAAEKCASLVNTFTAELTSRDFAAFWYSWSRIGFATTSNFVCLLFVQAPTTAHALKSKALVDTWRQTLRYQSNSFQHMSLGIIRLNGIYWSDMNKIFKVKDHVSKVLERSEA